MCKEDEEDRVLEILEFVLRDKGADSVSETDRIGRWSDFGRLAASDVEVDGLEHSAEETGDEIAAASEVVVESCHATLRDLLLSLVVLEGLVLSRCLCEIDEPVNHPPQPVWIAASGHSFPVDGVEAASLPYPAQGWGNDEFGVERWRQDFDVYLSRHSIWRVRFGFARIVCDGDGLTAIRTCCRCIPQPDSPLRGSAHDTIRGLAISTNTSAHALQPPPDIPLNNPLLHRLHSPDRRGADFRTKPDFESFAPQLARFGEDAWVGEKA